MEVDFVFRSAIVIIQVDVGEVNFSLGQTRVFASDLLCFLLADHLILSRISDVVLRCIYIFLDCRGIIFNGIFNGVLHSICLLFYRIHSIVDHFLIRRTTSGQTH